MHNITAKAAAYEKFKFLDSKNAEVLVKDAEDEEFRPIRDGRFAVV